MDKTKCPLCRSKRTNPCLLTVSGYVFCYPCIFSYLDKERKCPVTEVRVEARPYPVAGYLRKLYDEEE